MRRHGLLSRKMSRGSLVMNYSKVKTAPVCGLIIFTVITDQHIAAISVQVVDDVGYSLTQNMVLTSNAMHSCTLIQADSKFAQGLRICSNNPMRAVLINILYIL